MPEHTETTHEQLENLDRETSLWEDENVGAGRLLRSALRCNPAPEAEKEEHVVHQHR
jgi:hypothetical protein